MNLRSALALTCTTGLALMTVACGGPPPPSAPSPLLGRPVPELHRRALEGAEVESAKAQGHVIVVDFFAKYCEPCRRSLPALQRFHRAEPDVVVVGIGEDEDESDVREMMSTFGLTFDVIHDRGQALAGRFRVKDLPMTFVVGPEGSVRWAGGEVSESELGRVVAAARRARE